MAENTAELANEIVAISISELIQGAQEELATAETSEIQVLLAMKNFQRAYEAYLDYLLRYRAVKKNKVAVLPNFIAEKNRLEEEAYVAFFDFQNLFNEFFKQRIQMIYVVEGANGRELVLVDNDMSDIVRNQWGGLSYQVNQIERVLRWSKDEYDPSSLDNTANEVFRRWDIAMERHSKTSWLPILWKFGKTWSGAFVNNKGSLNEAYANFYINQFYFKFGMEKNVSIYVTDQQYGVAAVDNTGGFVIGDVTYTNNNNTSEYQNTIQFAIKGKNAGPMGMAAVYKSIVKALQTFQDEFKTIDLLNEIRQMVSKPGNAHQMRQMTEAQLDKEIESLHNMLTT